MLNRYLQTSYSHIFGGWDTDVRVFFFFLAAIWNQSPFFPYELIMIIYYYRCCVATAIARVVQIVKSKRLKFNLPQELPKTGVEWVWVGLGFCSNRWPSAQRGCNWSPKKSENGSERSVLSQARGPAKVLRSVFIFQSYIDDIPNITVRNSSFYADGRTCKQLL